MLTTIKNKILRYIHKSIYKPGHFYSAVPSYSDVDRRKKINHEDDLSGIDLKVEDQTNLLDELISFKDQFVWEKTKSSGLRYYTDNLFFTHFDGYILFSMMMKYRPKKIIEVGSGFSSALMLDVNDKYLNRSVDFTFIDPWMGRLNELLNADDKHSKQVNILSVMIQEVDLTIFDKLEAGDILFIDSSHVSKVASDVNFEVFKILPRLKKGVIIHFHDIFHPFEYPSDWLEMGIYWNEAYLLRAFLMFNTHFSILMFNNYWNKAVLPNFGTVTEGGSLWLIKN